MTSNDAPTGATHPAALTVRATEGADTEQVSAMINSSRLWTDLSPMQADGLACVVCGCNYLTNRVASVPVGRSVTGSQVHACSGSCAVTITRGAL